MQTICLIEDDKITRKLFVMLLQRANFVVQDFEDGSSALAWLGANTPDAVLSNIVLREGVGGRDILAYLRNDAKTARTPVFALTSFVRRGEKEQYIEMGFNGCIAKPIDPQTFAQDFRSLLSSLN